MNHDLISQIDQQIAHHEAEAKKLRAARALLASGPNGAASARIPRGKPGGMVITAPVKRAPAGFLEAAMEKAVRAKPGMTNGEVGKALEKEHYPYPVTPLHRGKRLSAMVEEGRLTRKTEGTLPRYYPAKA